MRDHAAGAVAALPVGKQHRGYGRRQPRHDQVDDVPDELGSGFINRSQKITVAEMRIAAMKVWAQRP